MAITPEARFTMVMLLHFVMDWVTGTAPIESLFSLFLFYKSHNLQEYNKFQQVCLNTVRYDEPENADTSFKQYEIYASLQSIATQPAKLSVIRQEGAGFIPTNNSLTESALSIYLAA